MFFRHGDEGGEASTSVMSKLDELLLGRFSCSSLAGNKPEISSALRFCVFTALKLFLFNISRRREKKTNKTNRSRH